MAKPMIFSDETRPTHFTFANQIGVQTDERPSEEAIPDELGRAIQSHLWLANLETLSGTTPTMSSTSKLPQQPHPDGPTMMTWNQLQHEQTALVNAHKDAPYASRKARRRQFEHLLGRPKNHTHIHTRWAPANDFTFAQRIRSMQFDTLSEVAEQLTKIAREETAYANAHSTQKRRLLEGARKSKDPSIKKAFIIHLQAFRREKRVAQEQRRLIDSAKGKDCNFSKQAKLAGLALVPQELKGEKDRGTGAPYCRRTWRTYIMQTTPKPRPSTNCYGKYKNGSRKDQPPNSCALPTSFGISSGSCLQEKQPARTAPHPN